METNTRYNLVFFSLAWAVLSSAWPMLSMPWALAQLGWIAGPSMLILFSMVTSYTAHLLFICSVNKNENYTYAVREHLGGNKANIYKLFKYINCFGACIGSTISVLISIKAIKRSNCLHTSGEPLNNPCHIRGIVYIISFGFVEILLSQVPEFHKLWWFSTLSSTMSFTYSTIGFGLGLSKVIENRGVKGNITGITVPPTQKVWRSFKALGNIAFAYSYVMMLVEIREKIKFPPSESKTVKTPIMMSVIVTTVFYMLCGCAGYGAFGEHSSENLLTNFGYGFNNPFWLLDIANAAIIIHLAGAFQLFSRPIYSVVEKTAAKRFPNNYFINKNIQIPIPFMVYPLKINLFKLVWRSCFVIITTIISVCMPFLNDVVGFIGAIVFWPRTVYFPVKIYIVQKIISKWSKKWICLQILCIVCLLICLAAAAVSLASVIFYFLL